MRRAYLLGGTAAALTAAVHRSLWHVAPLRSVPPARPVKDYGEAMAAVEQLQAEEGAECGEALLDECRSRVWSHGRRTKRAFVLLHGYTNCPKQYDQFGDRLHEAGHAVFAPRLPYHGQATRVPSDLHRMTAEESVELVSRALDAAQGLGEQVTVMGISFGGVLAAWAAQNRADVGMVMLAAPALGLRRLAQWPRPVAANMLRLRPNEFRWWDPVLKTERMGPPHGYVGFSTRGLGHLMRLAVLVEKQAKRKAPAAGKIVVVTNPCDELIDNREAQKLAALWRMRGAAVSEHELPVSLGLIHDFMDATQPKQQVEQVYPGLLDLLLEGHQAHSEQRPSPPRG